MSKQYNLSQKKAKPDVKKLIGRINIILYEQQFEEYIDKHIEERLSKSKIINNYIKEYLPESVNVEVGGEFIGIPLSYKVVKDKNSRQINCSNNTYKELKIYMKYKSEDFSKIEKGNYNLNYSNLWDEIKKKLSEKGSINPISIIKGRRSFDDYEKGIRVKV